MMRFSGKVCLVTGSSKGIGLAIARRFASEGAVVIMADRDEKALRAAADGVSGECSPYPVPLDVTDDARCASVVHDAVSRFGGIHVLVNNAGIYARGDAAATDPDVWERILRVNVTGAFLLTRHVLPHMIRQGRGSIVNIASEAGLVAIPGQVAYNVSKAAMIAFTLSLAVDHARHGIRANAVCPGTTWTPLVQKALSAQPDPEAARRHLEQCRPLNRLGRPEEIAAAVAFLASDEAEYATGAILSVDGGYTAQ